MNYKTYKVEVYNSGNKYWYNDKGQQHNEHGPAVEFANGYKAYYLNGKRHRTDGPAVEFVDGHKEYWLNGKLHRIDGPAVECANGCKEYWLNNKIYSYENWKKEVEKLNKSTVKELTVSEVSKLLGFDVKIVKE